MSSANDNIHSLVALIARSPETCWRAFVDPTALVAWVPGLRRATVVAARPDGLPLEIAFELSASLTYSLLYDYDLDRKRVLWEPRSGRRDAVRGFAEFSPAEGGACMTYGLELGPGRSREHPPLGEIGAVVSAFKRFVESGRPSASALRVLDAVDHVDGHDEERQRRQHTADDVSDPVHAEINAR